MIDNGATTIWERWDGYVKGRGFQDPGMNSFNHWAFGAVGEWMFRHILGIPRRKTARLRACPDPPAAGRRSPGSAATTTLSAAASPPPGTRDGDRIELRVTVPANVTAQVCLPAPRSDAWRESGLALKESPGVQLVKEEKDQVVLSVGSGEYVFSTPAE